MVRRPGDKTPDPPGGRAAQRLRMFVQARTPDVPSHAKRKKASKGKALARRVERAHAKQTRCKD